MKRTERIHAVVSEDELAALDEYAARADRSRSSVVRLAISSFIQDAPAEVVARGRIKDAADDLRLVAENLLDLAGEGGNRKHHRGAIDGARPMPGDQPLPLTEVFAREGLT